MGTSLEADDSTRLRWAVQALARPAEEQVQLYPDFTCKADELAIDFGDAAEPWLEAGRPGLTPEQSDALRALDDYLDAVSGGGPNAENWVEDALYKSPVWQQIRSLARAVLAAFGWQDACPPTATERGAVYVRGRQMEEPPE
jgi:hypothetical protein